MPRDARSGIEYAHEGVTVEMYLRNDSVTLLKASNASANLFDKSRGIFTKNEGELR